MELSLLAERLPAEKEDLKVISFSLRLFDCAVQWVGALYKRAFANKT